MRYYLRNIFLTLLLLAAVPVTAASLAGNRYAKISKLASGSWIKLRIYNSGIYQIPYSVLQSWGFDPTKAKVYGYGGGILPENFLKPYIDDLPEVPIIRSAGRILFYGEGTVTWEPSEKMMLHKQNCYSTAGYYFISQDDKQDTPIVKVEDNSSQPATATTIFDDYTLHESELCNVGNMGRNLYGEDFCYNTIQNFAFDTPGIIGDVNMQIDFIAKLSDNGKLTIKHNGNDLTKNDGKNIDAFGLGDDWYYTAAKLSRIKKTFTPNPSVANVITLQFAATNVKLARLDFIRLQMKRQLKLYGGSVKFRAFNASSRYLRYNIDITGYRSTHVWDITTQHLPEEVGASISGNLLSFTPHYLGVREYIAFDESIQYPSPEFVGEVANQNLHGLERADLVIIAPTQFYSQAKRLAEFHRDKDDMSALIIAPEYIYNEFSSGKPDATAYRRFMKMFYDRAETAGDKSLYPRYLLLFGDGSCDNRHITQEWKGYNFPFLLTFQSESSIDERSSYVTDDYFAFLKDTDGDKLLADKPVIGVGRFPVRNLTEATIAVDKVINYSNNTDYGIWKNDLCFVADDGNHSEHMKLADALVDIINKKHPEFFPSKIYIDAYNKVSSSNGGTYPDAKKEMFDHLNNGVLILNYDGHGSAIGWTAEKLLTIQDIRKMYLKRLPLFIAATCDFSRFDAQTTSAGEELFLNSKGGGIALISTTRVVYMDKNASFNKLLITHLFDRNEEGKRYRLGDVIKLAKTDVTTQYGEDLNKLNFILMGDPALQLAFPEHKVKITEINGRPITNNPFDIVLKARSEVTIKGVILDQQGGKDVNFNGYIQQRLYDTDVKITTHGNDEGGEPYDFLMRKNKLYTGKDMVKNGEFSFTFKMPKELNYIAEPGLLNMYAYDAGRKIEAQGSSKDFIVNGMDTNTEVDTEGPTIENFYLNTPAYTYGSTVNETPVFFANVYDKSGINLSGIGLGHNITLKIDDSANMEYVINNYFDPVPEEFGRGKIMYQMQEIPEGEHTLTFKVWDTEGNSSEKSTVFVVSKGLEPEIIQLYAKQNPVKEQAQFYLKHDRPNMVVQMKVSVYNLWGTEIWSSQVEGPSDMWISEPIIWDLTDVSGKRVPPGLYIYKAEINTEGSRISTDAKKIAVLAQ
ncbi:MAG: type IX secretion system sortase PorU [Bacteroidales bacterium]